MVHTVKSMYLDVTGKKKPTLHGRITEVEEETVSKTPEEKAEPKA